MKYAIATAAVVASLLFAPVAFAGEAACCCCCQICPTKAKPKAHHPRRAAQPKVVYKKTIVKEEEVHIKDVWDVERVHIVRQPIMHSASPPPPPPPNVCDRCGQPPPTVCDRCGRQPQYVNLGVSGACAGHMPGEHFRLPDGRDAWCKRR